MLLVGYYYNHTVNLAGIILLALIIGDRGSVITDSRMSLVDINAKHLPTYYTLLLNSLLCKKAYQRGCTVFHSGDFLLDLLSLALISAWLQSYLGFLTLQFFFLPHLGTAFRKQKSATLNVLKAQCCLL